MNSIDKTRVLALEYQFRIQLPRRIFNQAFQTALTIEELNERANELIKLLQPRFYFCSNRQNYREFSEETFQDDRNDFLSLVNKTIETIQKVDVQAERDYLTRLFVSSIDSLTDAQNSDFGTEKIQYYIDQINDPDEQQLALEHWGESVALNVRRYFIKCELSDLKTLILSIADQIEDQNSFDLILAHFLESIFLYKNRNITENEDIAETKIKQNVGNKNLNEAIPPIILEIFDDLLKRIESPVYRMFLLFRLSCYLKNKHQLSEKSRSYFDQGQNILNEISDSAETDQAVSEIFDSVFSHFSESFQEFPLETQIYLSLLKRIQNKQLAAKYLASFFRCIDENVIQNELSAEITEELFALITDLENFVANDHNQENETKIEILFALANIYYRLKQTKKAKNIVRTILLLLNQLDNESERSSFYLSLYLLHREVKQYSAANKLLDLLEKSTDCIVPNDFRDLQWKMIIGKLCSERNQDFASANRFLSKIDGTPEFFSFQTKMDWTQFDQYLTHLFQQSPDDGSRDYSDYPVYSENWIEQNVQDVFHLIERLESPLDQTKAFRLMLENRFVIRYDIDIDQELNPNIIPFE